MNPLIPKPQNTDLSEIPGESEVSILTSAQYQQLSDVPPAIEWFANINNLQTRRAYENDLRGFMKFVGINRPEDFRTVTRAHVLAWRKTLEEKSLAGATSEENSQRWLPCSSTSVKPTQ
jgi:integrase/recombinase XerD